MPTRIVHFQDPCPLGLPGISTGAHIPNVLEVLAETLALIDSGSSSWGIA